MPRGRDAIAIVGSRTARRLTRAAGYAGTSMPGLVAERLAPGIAARLARDLGPVTLVSGTNGKTTTGWLLATILERTGRRVLANPSGANLAQAIATALTSEASLGGGGLRRPGALGVFEVDEAALPRVARELPVAQLVLTNLFRDQLDRFGDTNEIVRRWGAMLAALGPQVRVVYCADDPRLAALTASRSAGAWSYGLAGPPAGRIAGDMTRDATDCPICAAPLRVEWVVVGHLGSYCCAGCGFVRPEACLVVRLIGSAGFADQTLGFHWQDAPGEQVVTIRLPGPGNAYNAAAAVAAAVALGVERRAAVAGLAEVSAPFGRWEALEIDGRQVVLSLVKNPASLDEVTRIGAEASVDAVLFAVNDTYADGRDVSWYWDVNPAALLAGRLFAVSGTRAADFQLRLKYQLVDEPGSDLPGLVGTFERPVEGLARLVAATPPGGTVLVVATYTALLGLRRELVARGLVRLMPT
jgi:lipid II isoglutaminyl synthase (glutamine-hydrolysing)